MPSHDFPLGKDDILLEALPDSVEETIRRRDKWVADRRRRTDGLEFIVSDVQRWTPGRTVRVAFLGGRCERRTAEPAAEQLGQEEHGRGDEQRHDAAASLEHTAGDREPSPAPSHAATEHAAEAAHPS